MSKSEMEKFEDGYPHLLQTKKTTKFPLEDVVKTPAKSEAGK